MVILGKQKNEMAAVHLMNSYCLLSLLYACETWSLKASSVHSANVALNNSFRRILNCCWRESPKILLLYCGVLPIYCTQCRRASYSFLQKVEVSQQCFTQGSCKNLLSWNFVNCKQV